MTFLDQKKIESGYRSEEGLWSKQPPNTYVVAMSKLLPARSRILDLGCGEGRNSLFLAQENFDVTGIDISEAAIEKLAASARSRNVSMHTQVADITKCEFGEGWDAIISTTALHLLSPNNQAEVVRRMKKATKLSGLNLITMFTKSDIGHAEYPNLSFLDLEDLQELYHDWNIRMAKTYTIKENHGGEHTHHIAIILAQKPQ